MTVREFDVWQSSKNGGILYIPFSFGTTVWEQAFTAPPQTIYQCFSSLKLKKGGYTMNGKEWAITAGLGAAAGAVAVLMMPRTNPTRRLAAKAANKMEDVAWKVSDVITEKLEDYDM